MGRKYFRLIFLKDFVRHFSTDFSQFVPNGHLCLDSIGLLSNYMILPPPPPGSILPTSHPPPDHRAPPVLRRPLHHGTERGDPFLSRLASGAKELQDLLRAHAQPDVLSGGP